MWNKREFKDNQDDTDLTLAFLKQMVAVEGHVAVHQHKIINEENGEGGVKLLT